jgi:hypothetical protein
MILGNHIVAPLFKGGGQDIPMPEGIFLKVLSKENIDCGQERLTMKVNFDEK